MAYQTILDRINGKVKSLYAPDGYVYVKEKESEIQKAIRKIELENRKESGVSFVSAPDVVFALYPFSSPKSYVNNTHNIILLVS